MEEEDESATSEWSDELSKLNQLRALKNLSEKERSELSILADEVFKDTSKKDASVSEVDVPSNDSEIQYEKLEPNERAMTRLNQLFVNHRDPFSLSNNNLPHRITAAYRSIRHTTIDDIAHYIVRHPENAEAFLKKHTGSKPLFFRNFREELGQRPDLLLLLYEAAKNNKTLNATLEQTSLSKTKHLDLEKTSDELSKTPNPVLQTEIDERRHKLLLERKRKYQGSWEKQLEFYERQLNFFENKNFPKIIKWLKEKIRVLRKNLRELAPGLTFADKRTTQKFEKHHSTILGKKEASESKGKSEESSREEIPLQRKLIVEGKGKSEEDSSPRPPKKPPIPDELLKYAEELRKNRQEFTDLKRDNPLMKEPVDQKTKKELKKEAKTEATDLKSENPLMRPTRNQ